VDLRVELRALREVRSSVCIEQRPTTNVVVGEAPELLVLLIREDESAVQIAQVDVSGHVVDQRTQARLLRSLTLDDAPELGSDAEQQVEQLRVVRKRLAREELEYSHDVGSRENRHGKPCPDPELDPFRRPPSAEALERNDLRAFVRGSLRSDREDAHDDRSDR